MGFGGFATTTAQSISRIAPKTRPRQRPAAWRLKISPNVKKLNLWPFAANASSILRRGYPLRARLMTPRPLCDCLGRGIQPESSH